VLEDAGHCTLSLCKGSVLCNGTQSLGILYLQFLSLSSRTP
jgi:hypothetical protein